MAFLFMAFTACQKEDERPAGLKPVVKSDSLSAVVSVNSPGTYLATKGTLKINVGDSTYTFDAAIDSVAFVAVELDSTQYFGITAINKEHTLSFGISSAGIARPDTNATVAGTQLLLSSDEKGTIQYTLPKYVSPGDVGKLYLVKFQQDSTLSRGTFYTTLATKGKSTHQRATGTFNLMK